jgi:hypothetical protein
VHDVVIYQEVLRDRNSSARFSTSNLNNKKRRIWKISLNATSKPVAKRKIKEERRGGTSQ